jgi:hypothetical protein
MRGRWRSGCCGSPHPWCSIGVPDGYWLNKNIS